MCCDGWTLNLDPGEEEYECPDCGGETIDGAAKHGCNYSPVTCETCGAAPCDDSC